MRPIRGLYVVRGGVGVPRVTSRADEGGSTQDTPDDGRLATLVVDFSRFGVWYEVNSWWEGHFIERTLRGAFANTIGRARRADGRYDTKVMFNHGFDMYINEKLLGVPEVLEEREDSPHLEAPLEDTTYNRDLLPLLKAEAYGSSFMFEVLGESWDREPERSDYNPEGLPERTITEVRLFEAGPVTWPANPESTSGVRMQSGTDWYVEQMQRRDPERYEELTRSYAAFRAYHGLRRARQAPAPSVDTPDPTALAAGTEPARHVGGVTAAARKRRLTLIDLAGK